VDDHHGSDGGRRPLPVAAIVPCRDSPWLQDVVDALWAGRCTPREVVVVDDGSIRPITDVRGARVIRTPGLGRAAARNLGVRATTDPYLLFVDADMFVCDDTLLLLHEALEDRMDGAMALCTEADLSGYEGFRLTQLRFSMVREPTPRHLAAGCLLVRRACFDEIGGFPALPAMEDVSFGIAGWSMGFRWRAVVAAGVAHVPRRSSWKVFLRDHRERGIAGGLLVARQGVVMEHSASRRDLAAFAASLVALASAVLGARAPSWRRVAMGAAASSWLADLPWLRYAWREKGGRFAAGSVVWIFLFRVNASVGVVRGLVAARRAARRRPQSA
jgi:Glycosyl transferase family 2